MSRTERWQKEDVDLSQVGTDPTNKILLMLKLSKINVQHKSVVTAVVCKTLFLGNIAIVFIQKVWLHKTVGRLGKALCGNRLNIAV